MIIVQPVRKDQKLLNIVDPKFRKGINNNVNGLMPNIYMATDGELDKFEEGKVACVGFRYRRQSHHCEIWWWHGDNQELLVEAIKACMAAAILEGRKRVECFNEQLVTWDIGGFTRGGEMFDAALEAAGLVKEGRHEDWTKHLEPVNVFGWVWLHDGLPVFKDDTIVKLGENDTTLMYREKNIELYVKDRDYYSRVEDGGGLSFAEHIKKSIDYIYGLPQVEILKDWSSK